MDVTPLVRKGQQIIQSYAGGKFRVSGQIYEGAIIVTPDAVLPWDALSNVTDLKIEHFMPLTLPLRGSHPLPGGEGAEQREAGEGVDIILLGTGAKMQFLPAELRRALKEQGLSVDAMDTGAACRTYNVLMAEGRRVAAALLPSV